MPGHFLLSSAAKTYSLKDILCMSEDQAYEECVKIRFDENDGKPFCPKCSCKAVYAYKVRRIFKCKDCRRQFSVTSGTAFAWRKAEFRHYLAAIFIFVNAKKGISAIQLSHDLKNHYKTIFVLLHKLREVMNDEQMKGGMLEGTVEVDGAYYGGYVKPPNIKNLNKRSGTSSLTPAQLQKQQQIKLQQAQKRAQRLSVITLRERGGRTRTTVAPSEAAAKGFIIANIRSDAEVHTDEAPTWIGLSAHFRKVRVINHAERFSKEGACTNFAESYFSRFRRSHIGQHHRFSRTHVGAYAAEMAWREDRRRRPSKTLYENLASAALHHPPTTWRGYWHRAARAKKAAAHAATMASAAVQTANQSGQFPSVGSVIP